MSSGPNAEARRAFQTISPILPGSTLGILGSGQLGRMTAMAAKAMGYRVVVMGAAPDDPAAQVADEFVRGELGNPDDVLRLAQEADVVTPEIENIDPAGVEALEAVRPVRPGAHVLAVAQDRRREKESMERIGVPVAPFRPVGSLKELEDALAVLGCPCILKTTRGGYDGRGQVRIERPEEAGPAFRSLGEGRVGLLVEAVVPFVKEVSVVVARTPDGRTEAFPVAENEHRNGILHRTIAPARIDPAVAAEARALAGRVAEALGVVGLLAVEMFLDGSGRLLVNELAPRPHNSGHYTLDACVTSQFEQNVRAVCGLALGSPEQFRPAVMLNILGEHLPAVMEHYTNLLMDPYVKIHLYGKAEARKGRKMGHLLVTGAAVGEAVERAERLWSTYIA